MDATGTALDAFFTPWYRLHNSARLAHLASLGLPLDGRTVLDAGSGPGGHTGFYLHRGCTVTAADARPECLHLLSRRFPGVATVRADFDSPTGATGLGRHDVVHCYGLLYHVSNPECALDILAAACARLLVLETCLGEDAAAVPRPVAEDRSRYTQSAAGAGCLPSRRWLFEQLQRRFAFVYQTRTQPRHPEFPTDWTRPASGARLRRGIFVAAREALPLPTLSAAVLDHQEEWYPS